MINHKAKILIPKILEKYSYPLPKSWVRAAGILKAKKPVNPLKYQKQIRQEWNERLEKLIQ